MSDTEYDALKQSLVGRSVFTLPREGPVCTLGKPGVKGQKQGEAQTDYAKMLLLTVPPTLIVSSGGLSHGEQGNAPLLGCSPLPMAAAPLGHTSTQPPPASRPPP